MTRLKIKGNRNRRQSSPMDEPDFYAPCWTGHKEPTYPPGLKRDAANNLYPTALRKMKGRLSSLEMNNYSPSASALGLTQTLKAGQSYRDGSSTFQTLSLNPIDFEPTPFPQFPSQTPTPLLRLVDPVSNIFSVNSPAHQYGFGELADDPFDDHPQQCRMR
eukprot:CAMPEP_0172459292 /NCGR_PEP_ID=MMETSP1065-20121228/31892_1 /TAXON_ID=265537 /ORGANISM="Amphiprora paludosa, Strain CCMP125" /LENGTH=160 /DNA_ID=CAMNT_0013213913 /DNA_START=524 /DNA_END=1006 /DNA_ORIENTATION=-